MRIAHVDTERTWRGGEQQVFSLVEGLEKNGHHNVAVVWKGGALAHRLKGKIPLWEMRPLGEWDFIAAHQLNRQLKRERIDLLHAHSGHGAALAAFASLGTKIPVIVTRRVDFHLSGNIFSRWKYKRARRIVAISNGVKQILLQDGIPSEKISIVPSGVDFNRYTTVKAISRAELKVPSETILIGQVAALAPHKDQNNLLEAIAHLRVLIPNIRVIIIGEGFLRASLEKRISELGLEDVVQLLGFKERPLDYVAAFDVFCLSSKEEGLGTSLIDAMALRIPVVATKVGGIPELISEGKTGYLAPGSDHSALAKALQRCIEQRQNNSVLLDSAQQKAKEFDISNTIHGMEAIYSQLSTELST